MYVCMILPRRLCLREGNRTHTSTMALGPSRYIRLLNYVSTLGFRF